LKSKLSQITAIQSNPLVSGFFLDQWADIGVDFSGLTDENRKSKGLETFAKEISTPTRLLLSGLEPVNTPQSEVSFQLALLNAARLENVEIEITVVDKNAKTITTQKHQAKGQTSLTPLGTFTVIAPKVVEIIRFNIN
jgi:hypothetical protein